jgi:hypothetical protein
LLHIQNYYNPVEAVMIEIPLGSSSNRFWSLQCFQASWYLSADFQLVRFSNSINQTFDNIYFQFSDSDISIAHLSYLQVGVEIFVAATDLCCWNRSLDVHFSLSQRI